MSTLLTVVLLLTALVAVGQPTLTRSPSERPNIIVVLADDLGYGGLGCYGHPTLQTPHLDSLAARGIRFTDFHANAPVCTPTRASLLTGNYPQRSGLEGVIYVRGETRQVGLDTTTLTLAELLREHGYATGMVGKWHLGYQPEYNPVHHGFDSFHGYVSGNIDYHSHYDNAAIYDWWHNLDTIQEKGYVTDLITDHSVDFIAQHRERPFFLYVAHEAPHVPFQGRNDPAYRFPGQEFTYHGPVEDTAATYAEMVEVMDEGVGSIMQALRKHNLEENTLVIFLSDNGAESFGHNGPLRGQKTTLYEGGHRVPAIAYWKGQINPRTSSDPVMSMDWLPTLLTIAHASAPSEATFDGVDLSSYLLNQQALAERPLFWRYRGQKVVRRGAWKLLITPTDTALYQLEDDLQETTNQYASHPRLANELHSLLAKWEDTLHETALKTD